MSGMTTIQGMDEINELIVHTLSLAQDLLTDIFHQIDTLDSFDEGKETKWNRHLTILTSEIGKFVEITTLISKLLGHKKNIQLPAIKNSHIHLLFVLKAISQAQLKSDALVLEDLIKYELRDNLTQWKIDLIPQTKRLLNA